MEKYYLRNDKNEIVIFVKKSEYTKDMGKKLGTTNNLTMTNMKKILRKPHKQDINWYFNYKRGMYVSMVIEESYRTFLEYMGVKRSDDILVVLGVE